jgi:SAM-dependent methyltransferase
VNGFYDEDLAYVHSVGFSELSLAAGDLVLELLHGAGIDSGLVVDLGCGSGEWVARAVRAGLDGIGVDVSPAMLRLARSQAPAARFVQSTLFAVELPPCVAVTAFGEGLSYAAPALPDLEQLKSLFSRVKASLAQDGLFVFDVIVSGPAMGYRGWTAGDDWAVLVDVSEDGRERVVSRDITVFRDPGSGYRRSSETHRQRVWDPGILQDSLESLGFAVTTSRHYMGFELGPRRLAFVAQLPAT